MMHKGRGENEESFSRGAVVMVMGKSLDDDVWRRKLENDVVVIWVLVVATVLVREARSLLMLLTVPYA